MPRIARPFPPNITLLLLYWTSGLIWGAWIERIDATQHHLGLTQSQLGVVLPSFPIGAIIAFPVAAMVSARFGSGRSVVAFGLLRAAVFPLLGLAPDMPALMGALALSGFAHGGLEVSLNTQGVDYEHQTSKSILARGAALSSIGMLTSSLGMWLYVRTDLPYETPFLIPAVIGVAMFLLFGRGLLPDAPTQRSASATAQSGTAATWRRWIPPYVLWVLLVFAFVAEVADEAVSEWVSIFLHDDLKSGPGIASLQYSAYTVTLLIGRLLGDVVVQRVAPLRILQLGGIFGAIGLLLGTIVDTSTAVLIGTGIIGLGTSLYLPTVYRLAGSAPGIPRERSLAMVETTVYLGYMVGPMVIGPLSDATSLRFALLCVGALYLVVPVVGQLSRSTKFAPPVLATGPTSAPPDGGSPDAPGATTRRA